jgi:hypothetical protein
MKATIKIVTACKEFNEDQKKVIRRIMMVLDEHDLSVCLEMKKKVTKNSKKVLKKVS